MGLGWSFRLPAVPVVPKVPVTSVPLVDLGAGPVD